MTLSDGGEAMLRAMTLERPLRDLPYIQILQPVVTSSFGASQTFQQFAKVTDSFDRAVPSDQVEYAVDIELLEGVVSEGLVPITVALCPFTTPMAAASLQYVDSTCIAAYCVYEDTYKSATIKTQFTRHVKPQTLRWDLRAAPSGQIQLYGTEVLQSPWTSLSGRTRPCRCG